MKRTKIYLTTLLFILGIVFMANAQDIPTRDKIDDKYKWNLADLYKSNSDFEKDFKAVSELSDKFISHKGNVTKTSKNLLNSLNDLKKFGRDLRKLLYVWQLLLYDTDVSKWRKTNFE